MANTNGYVFLKFPIDYGFWEVQDGLDNIETWYFKIILTIYFY